MSYRSIVLELVVDCTRCGRATAVEASDQMECVHCGHVSTLSPSFWRRVLAAPLVDALAIPEGKGRTAHVRSSPTARLLYGPNPLRCVHCSTALPLEEVAETAGSDRGSVFCPQCGRPNPVRAAPEWLKQINQGVIAVANEPSRLAENDRQRGRHRWSVLFDVSDAEDVLPLGAVLCDCAPAPGHRVVAAWHGETPDLEPTEEPVVGLVDARGLLRWTSDECDFGPLTSVHVDPWRGVVWLVDPEAGGVWWLDLEDGRSLRAAPLPFYADGQARSSTVQPGAMAIAPNGTLVVAVDSGDGFATLFRVGLDGERVPLWHGGSLEEDDESSAVVDWQSFDYPPDRPARLPSDSLLAVGQDGGLVVVDRWTGKLVRYHPTGELAYRIDRALDIIHRIEAIAVEPDDQVLMLFAHIDAIGPIAYPHIGRLAPDGTFHVWLGPHVEGSPELLGREAHRLRVGSDGSVLIGDQLDMIRVLRPEGSRLWVSPLLPRAEQRLADHLRRDRQRSRRPPRAG